MPSTGSPSRTAGIARSAWVRTDGFADRNAIPASCWRWTAEANAKESFTVCRRTRWRPISASWFAVRCGSSASRVQAQFPRWVHVRTEEGPLGAVTFVINRDGGRYVCGLSLEQTADLLAAAVGPFGSMAEYLYSTVSHLEALGLHDSHLWRLQELVAERIEASAAAHRPVSSTATARTEASGLGQ